MIFQRFSQNKKKEKGKTAGTIANPRLLYQPHGYCSKYALSKGPGGNLTGFGKFRGRIDRFIVEGVM
jgi:hypothetical protein